MKKKLTALVCMFVCIFALAGCGSSDSTDYAAEYDEELLCETTQYIIYTLEDMDDEDVQAIVDMRNEEIDEDDDTALAIKAGYESWLDSKEELGSFTPTQEDSYTFEADEDGATVVYYATFEERDAKVTAYYDYNSDLTSFYIEPVYTTMENFQNGLLNTIIGLCVVFGVLILIAFIIYLFKYINKAERYFEDRKYKKEQEKEAKEEAEFEPLPPPPAFEESASEEEVDDLELVAVITAALAASLDTSADQLVVRSIKRKSGKQWQKA